MNTERIMHIPLTGEESHVVSISAGQGSLSIGTKGISKGKHEVWVEKDQPINWDAFNELYTPYGKQNMETIDMIVQRYHGEYIYWEENGHFIQEICLLHEQRTDCDEM